jgi:filamentous hemagglutinin
LCFAGVAAFVASLGRVGPVPVLASVVAGGLAVRVASFGSGVAPGFVGEAAGVTGFFVAGVMALASSLVGGLGAGVATFMTCGAGRCTGVSVLGCAGAGSSARGAALAAGGPGGTARAAAAGLGLGGGGAALGAREVILVRTRAIATPVATAAIPTVSQLRVARRGGAGATRKASFELAGMGGGSGATIEVASWPWALVDHRLDERRGGGGSWAAVAATGNSSSATIISGSTSITSASLG